MKKIKILLLLLTISVAGFYSCTDNDPVENEVVTTKSIGIRTVLNYIKKGNNSAGRSSQSTSLQSTSFGFDFVYPITLSYNNGTTITVASYEGLIEVLTNENENLYIDGIAFPFQVVLASDGSTVTINNEEEFWDLIDTIEIETIDDYAFSSLCYDFVYPFSLIDQNNQTIVISNQNDLLGLFTNPNNQTVILDFVYPFSVISNNETVVINDAYEFFDLNSDCLPTVCICPTDYNPVCVNTSNGIEEFSNACYAECAGYTAADFVNCNPNTGSGFDQLGTCFTVVYPIQVQFQGAVYTIFSDNELLTFLNAPGGATVVYPIQINAIAQPITLTVASEQGLLDVTAQICN
jgi:hypothetical protein